MKSLSTILLLGLLIIAGDLLAQQYEYKIITSVESIVPMGLGRSRLIQEKETVDTEQFTTDRTDGTKTDLGKVKRKDLKIDNFSETKMLNFYSGVGLNFHNVASNDALLSAALTEQSKEGWELFTVVSGVESDAGGDDGKGIFITRYIFRKAL